MTEADTMASKLIAIIAGVGAGTGASVARKFAASYPVVLLARKAENYQPLVDEINGKGGKAIGVSTDVSDRKSVDNAISEAKKAFGSDVGVAAAVFNASGAFNRKPFFRVERRGLQEVIRCVCSRRIQFFPSHPAAAPLRGQPV